MIKRKKIIYESHPREYTMVTGSKVSSVYCTKLWQEFNGMYLPEIILVIQDGQYVYYVQQDSLYDISKSFINKRLNKGKVKIEKLWRDFDFKLIIIIN